MDWRRYGVHRTAPAFQTQPHNLSPEGYEHPGAKDALAAIKDDW